MREKYESLSLAALKDVAKARGLKGISTMKKADLVDRMVAEDEKEEAQKAKTAPVKAEVTKAEVARTPARDTLLCEKNVEKVQTDQILEKW